YSWTTAPKSAATAGAESRSRSEPDGPGDASRQRDGAASRIVVLLEIRQPVLVARTERQSRPADVGGQPHRAERSPVERVEPELAAAQLTGLGTRHVLRLARGRGRGAQAAPRLERQARAGADERRERRWIPKLVAEERRDLDVVELRDGPVARLRLDPCPSLERVERARLERPLIRKGKLERHAADPTVAVRDVADLRAGSVCEVRAALEAESNREARRELRAGTRRGRAESENGDGSCGGGEVWAHGRRGEGGRLCVCRQRLDMRTRLSRRRSGHAERGAALASARGRPAISPMATQTVDLEHPKQRKYADVRNYRGGAFVDDDLPLADVHDPSTGAAISRVPMSTAREVDAAVRRAREALPSWAATPIKERVQVFYKYKALLEAELAGLAALVTEENGKIDSEARAEVLKAAELSEFACSLPQIVTGEVLEVS